MPKFSYLFASSFYFSFLEVDNYICVIPCAIWRQVEVLFQKVCRFLLNSEGCSTHKNSEVKYQYAGNEVRVCIFFCLWFDVLVADLREFTCFHGKESHRWMFEGENKLFRIRFSSDTVSIIEGAGSKLYCLFCLVTFKYFSTGLASCKQSISHLSDLVLSAGWYISSNVHNIVVSIMFQMPCLRFL